MLGNDDEKNESSAYGTHKNDNELDNLVIESDLLGLEDHKEKIKKQQVAVESEAAYEEESLA